MVSACIQTCPGRLLPVFLKARIPMAAPLRGLYIRKGNVLGAEHGPVNIPLVVGHINSAYRISSGPGAVEEKPSVHHPIIKNTAAHRQDHCHAENRPQVSGPFPCPCAMAAILLFHPVSPHTISPPTALLHPRSLHTVLMGILRHGPLPLTQQTHCLPL